MNKRQSSKVWTGRKNELKCPSCKVGTLAPSFIESGFRGHQCTHCKGHWLYIDDYVGWLEGNSTQLKDGVAEYELEDTKTAMVCPATGAVMQKFRISNDTTHKLDYSAQVGGVWLDPGEWQYLKDQGLAHSLNKVFTDQWQQLLRDNDTKQSFERLYVSKFGEEDYAKLKEIRAWLHSKENKIDLRSYLLAEDPYSVRSS